VTWVAGVNWDEQKVEEVPPSAFRVWQSGVYVRPEVLHAWCHNNTSLYTYLKSRAGRKVRKEIVWRTFVYAVEGCPPAEEIPE